MTGLVLAPALDAWAGNPYIEPYVGVGQMQVAVFQGGDYDVYSISTGFTAGIKAGYVFTQKFFVGADYHTGGPYKFGRQTNNAEWNLRMLGAGVGLDYGIGRFWVGYYFDQTIDDGKNQLKYKGDAFKIGFGLAAAKNVHANIDVVLHNIKEAQYSSGATTSSNMPRAQSFFVSVSLPIDFK